jgi:hypothetical protein
VDKEDKAKYEWGRAYAQFIKTRYQYKSVTILVDLVDSYKLIAYIYKDAISLGIADQLWQWILEKNYAQAAS